MTLPAEILLLSRDPERVRRWTRYLNDPKVRVWQTEAAIPADTSIDLIVTDDSISEWQLQDDRLTSRLTAGDTGVVGIGPDHSAAVRLPADVTARELRLACLLLTDTVRLQRELNRSRQTQAALNELAMTDSLTGLPNRRAWDDHLTLSGSPADGPFASLCVALLDLDHFKTINDRFGHLAGDRLLRHVGQRLASVVEESSFVARLGGDEFALLFHDRNLSTLGAEIEEVRILACVEAPHPVTASVGWAVMPNPAKSSPYLLLDAADSALRRAKTTGRNRTVVATVDRPHTQ